MTLSVLGTVANGQGVGKRSACEMVAVDMTLEMKKIEFFLARKFQLVSLKNNSHTNVFDSVFYLFIVLNNDNHQWLLINCVFLFITKVKG